MEDLDKNMGGVLQLITLLSHYRETTPGKCAKSMAGKNMSSLKAALIEEHERVFMPYRIPYQNIDVDGFLLKGNAHVRAIAAQTMEDVRNRMAGY